MIVDGVERRVFAEELAVEAGQLALSYRAREDLDVRSKGLLDWVTKADLATEQLIRRRIGESFPHDRILGEEEGDDAPRTGAGHVRESGGWSTDFMGDRSLTTSKPVLAANRGSVAALWDLAEGLLEGWSRPDRHDSQ